MPLTGYEVALGQAYRTPEPVGPMAVALEIVQQRQLHHQGSAKLLKRGYILTEQRLQKQLALPAGVGKFRLFNALIAKWDRISPRMISGSYAENVPLHISTLDDNFRHSLEVRKGKPSMRITSTNAPTPTPIDAGHNRSANGP